jgi:hypothetical protein
MRQDVRPISFNDDTLPLCARRVRVGWTGTRAVAGARAVVEGAADCVGETQAVRKEGSARSRPQNDTGGLMGTTCKAREGGAWKKTASRPLFGVRRSSWCSQQPRPFHRMDSAIKAGKERRLREATTARRDEGARDKERRGRYGSGALAVQRPADPWVGPRSGEVGLFTGLGRTWGSKRIQRLLLGSSMVIRQVKYVQGGSTAERSEAVYTRCKY